jgi:septal ring factor EnvC (AmiA/AmiB activator)
MAHIEPVKVATGMGFLFLLLIAALAYNMGGTAEESRDNQQFLWTQARVDAATQRVRKCESLYRKIETQKMTAEEVQKEVSASLEETTAEIERLRMVVNERSEKLKSCERAKTEEADRFESSPDQTAELRIQNTLAEIAAANRTLDSVVQNRTNDERHLLRLLLAFRRANEAMSPTANKKPSAPAFS